MDGYATHLAALVLLGGPLVGWVLGGLVEQSLTVILAAKQERESAKARPERHGAAVLTGQRVRLDCFVASHLSTPEARG
jgi:hypothetical protein